MTTPTRILLSDDLYALEEEMDDPLEEAIIEFRRAGHERVREYLAPGTEPPREMRPSPLLGMLAAGISGAVVGAVVMAMVLT